MVGKKRLVPCTMTWTQQEKDRAAEKSKSAKLAAEMPYRLTRQAHIDETVSECASPSERVRHSLEDGLAGSLLARLAEVFDLETPNGEFAIRLVQPTRLARSGGKREEGDDTDAGGEDSLCGRWRSELSSAKQEKLNAPELMTRYGNSPQEQRSVASSRGQHSRA